MAEVLYRVELREPSQAREALARCALPWVGEQLAMGKELVAEFSLREDDRSDQQHKYYWAVVLQDVAEGVVVGGQRYTKDAWHEYGKREFLPRKTKKVKVAGRRRPVVSTVIQSTTGLTVRQMGQYLEKWMAFAAEHGVTVSEPLPPHLRPQRRARKVETVDQDTGEILEHA